MVMYWYSQRHSPWRSGGGEPHPAPLHETIEQWQPKWLEDIVYLDQMDYHLAQTWLLALRRLCGVCVWMSKI